MLDLRVPIGWFFGLIGIILLAYCLLARPQAPLASYEVDAFAGCVMLLFASIMLWLSRRK